MKTKDGRSYFPVPFSIRKYLGQLTGDEYKAVGDAVFAYAIDGINDPPQLTPLGLAAYLRWVEEIDERNAEYQRKCEQNYKNRTQGLADKRVYDAAANSEPDSAPRPAATVRPTLDEVEAYADANGLTTIDPQRFLDACQAAGWMYNRQPMNWKAYAKVCHNKALRAASTKTVSAQQYTQREYSAEFLDSLCVDIGAEIAKNEQ